MPNASKNFMVKVWCATKQKEVWANHTSKDTLRCVACGFDHPKVSAAGSATVKVEFSSSSKKKGFKKGRTQKKKGKGGKEAKVGGGA